VTETPDDLSYVWPPAPVAVAQQLPASYPPPAMPNGTDEIGPVTEPFAIASLSLSVFGVVAVVGPVFGIVFGFIARSRIRRSEGRSKGNGLAIAGIIIGFVDILLAIVLAVGLIWGSTGGDQALAASELLPASSYPAGFSGQGSGTAVTGANYFGGAPPAAVRILESCLGMGPLPQDIQPVERADQTYVGGTVAISDTVDVYPSASLAADDVRASARPGALTCLFQNWGPTIGQDLSPDMGPGEHDGPPTPVSVSSDGSVRSDDRWSIAYTYEGGSGRVFNDWVAVRMGRSVSYIDFSDLDSPVPARLLAVVLARVSAQMSGQ